MTLKQQFKSNLGNPLKNFLELYHSLETEEEINELLILACKYFKEDLAEILLRDPRCDVTYQGYQALRILLGDCLCFKTFKLILNDPRTDLASKTNLGSRNFLIFLCLYNDDYPNWLLEIIKHPTTEYDHYMVISTFQTKDKACIDYIMETEYFLQTDFPSKIQEQLFYAVVVDYDNLLRFLRFPHMNKIKAEDAIRRVLRDEPSPPIECVELVLENFEVEPKVLYELGHASEWRWGRILWKTSYNEEEIERISRILERKINSY